MNKQSVNNIVSGDGLIEEFYTILWMKHGEGAELAYPFSLP